MYENIQNVMNNQAPVVPTKQMSLQEQAESYEIFDKMMKSGIPLKSLVDKIAELEKKIEQTSTKPAVNEELFSVMEQSVRKDPSVIEAKLVMDRMMKSVITTICMKDPGFAKAAEDYRTIVNKAYIDKNENQADTSKP